MDFVIRFLILTVITFTVLSVATEKWAKHYVWLIIGFMILAGFVFYRIAVCHNEGATMQSIETHSEIRLFL